MEEGGSTQPLALCFLNLMIFLWILQGILRGYWGKAKPKELLLPLAQNVVESAVILVCVCDLLPAPAKPHLRDKPLSLQCFPSQVTGRGCLQMWSDILSPVSKYKHSLWWWHVLQEYPGKEMELIVAFCILYRVTCSNMTGRRWKQIFWQSELSGHCCYSDQFSRSLRLQSDLNCLRESTKSDFPGS